MANNKQWVLILGGSSGFGLAIAEKFSKKGFNLIIVHRNKRCNLKNIEQKFNEFRKNDATIININTNAVTTEGRNKIFEKIRLEFSVNDKIKLFVHSIADGNINDILKNSAEELENTFSHTVNSMGTSFVLYARELIDKNLFADNARIIGLTSEGSTKYLKGYSMVGAAKSVLESLSRSMAVEFAGLNITTNLINPGITDTNALKVLPEQKELLEKTKNRNPFKRLTTPNDVANVVWLLIQDEAAWINGEIIRVDGGEQINF